VALLLFPWVVETPAVGKPMLQRVAIDVLGGFSLGT